MNHFFKFPSRTRVQAVAIGRGVFGGFLLVAATSVVAQDQDCKLKMMSRMMKVGEAADFGPVSLRFDVLEPSDPLDKYQVSVKDNSTDAMLLNHGVVPRYQTVQVKTRCGTLSIAADRAYETIRLPVVVTLSLF